MRSLQGQCLQTQTTILWYPASFPGCCQHHSPGPTHVWDPPPWPISGVITIMLFSAFNASHPFIGPPPTAALVYHFGPSHASPLCERCCLYCTFQTSVHLLCTTVRGFPSTYFSLTTLKKRPRVLFLLQPCVFPREVLCCRPCLPHPESCDYNNFCVCVSQHT